MTDLNNGPGIITDVATLSLCVVTHSVHYNYNKLNVGSLL